MSKTAKDIISIGPQIGTKHVHEYPAGYSSEGWKEEEWRNFGDEAEGRFFGGVWFGEPGSIRVDDFAMDEFCYIRKGSVRLIDASGQQRSFSVNEGFFVPRGFVGKFEVVESAEMAYVALGPF